MFIMGDISFINNSSVLHTSVEIQMIIFMLIQWNQNIINWPGQNKQNVMWHGAQLYWFHGLSVTPGPGKAIGPYSHCVLLLYINLNSGLHEYVEDYCFLILICWMQADISELWEFLMDESSTVTMVTSFPSPIF